MQQFTTMQNIAIFILPVMFAITLHEVAHGWVASLCGDQTARLSGRLTLNPFKHVDLIGTIIVPMVMLLVSNFIFGWAKPVPVDARNMRKPRRDMALVAAAGPIANLLMACCWAIITKLSILFFNVNTWATKPLVYMGQVGIMINVMFAVLNCFPIPPLDGWRMLCSILPSRAAWHVSRIEPYMIFVILLLMVTGIFSYIIIPPVLLLIGWITSVFGLPG